MNFPMFLNYNSNGSSNNNNNNNGVSVLHNMKRLLTINEKCEPNNVNNPGNLLPSPVSH